MQAKKFSNIGLSERQAGEHFKLYEGYCKKIEEIRKKIIQEEGNSTYSEIRELKIEEGFALNAVKLHELYFENLGKGNPSGKFLEIIEKDFGTLENWKKELVSCGLSARGWVVLAYDNKDSKLHNYICDMHNQGGIWDSIPILVLDMYEHAYFIDYGTDKKSYISWFLDNIKWDVIEKRAKIK